MVSRAPKAEQLERALLYQLERLEARIVRLRNQQSALQAALIEHRSGRLSYKGAIRRNSFSKLIVRKRVVDKIRKEGGDTTLEKLYNAVIAGNETDPMPVVTFRSHLHRMKQDGFVISGHARGTYKLGPMAPKA